MPELPDVERFRRVLERHAVGKRIESLEVRDAGVIRGREPEEFAGLLVGRQVVQAERLGKWLLAATDGPTLLLHFGMTGSLLWQPPETADSRFDRVVFGIASSSLVFRDQRKLRGLWLATAEEEIARVTGAQGPDALGLSKAQLEKLLSPRKGALKSVLMDQHVVAGLGNMLSDEVLWRAGIHPGRRFAQLDAHERQRLARSLRQVLAAAVEAGAIPRSRSWLSSQRSVPEPRCPRCRRPLDTSRIAGRTSYWCPACQSRS